MQRILQINTSIFGADGNSTRLANRLVGSLRDRHPRAMLRVRDLGTEPPPHLDAAGFNAFRTPAPERSLAQRQVAARSDALIDELRRADAVVIGLPMYNLGVPSGLKAYFDHIARAGETFRYTAQGPEGLLADRKIYVVATRGGVYRGTDKDTQSAYIRDFFALLGITDVEFVYAEGLNMGDEHAERGLAEARERLGQLAA